MRNIKTTYYSDWKANNVVQTNSGTDPNRSVAQCVLHMQIDHYNALLAEVWDSTTGELHALVKRSVNGDITILYKRDPREYERKLAFAAFNE